MIAVDDELQAALASARHLLEYALEHGVTVNSAPVAAIVKASTDAKAGTLDNSVHEQFWVAYADLVAATRPVTAESVNPNMVLVNKKEIKFYRWLAIGILIFVLPLSVLTYVANSIFQDLHQRILDVCSQEPELNCVTQGSFSSADAAQFKNVYAVGGTIVWAYFRLRWLNLLIVHWVSPDRIEGIWQKSWPEGAFREMLYLASDIGSRVQLVYGTLSAYVLPILYALLGAVAYRLRGLSNQIATESSSNSNVLRGRVRLMLALVAGAIAGIFTDFTKGLSVSSLGIGFLVGYSVEVFFGFLDIIVDSLGRVKP